MDVVADGIHQMGLAQSRIAVEEQRIVAFGWGIGHAIEKLKASSLDLPRMKLSKVYLGERWVSNSWTAGAVGRSGAAGIGAEVGGAGGVDSGKRVCSTLGVSILP